MRIRNSRNREMYGFPYSCKTRNHKNQKSAKPEITKNRNPQNQTSQETEIRKKGSYEKQKSAKPEMPQNRKSLNHDFEAAPNSEKWAKHEIGKSMAILRSRKLEILQQPWLKSGDHRTIGSLRCWPCANLCATNLNRECAAQLARYFSDNFPTSPN